MAKIVEFVGSGGSGKTTIARKIVRYLKSRGLRVVIRGNPLFYEYLRKNPPGKGIKALVLKRTPCFLGQYFANTFNLLPLMDLACRFEVRHPELTEMVFDAIKNNYRSEDGKTTALKMATKAFAGYQIIEELHGSLDDNTVIIMDEGLCKIAQVIYAGGDELQVEAIDSYLDRILLPNAVIHIDVEPSECHKRLVIRQGSHYFTRRFQQLSMPAQIQRLEDGRSFIAKICESLKSRSVPVYEVANNSNLESSLQSVRKYLNSYFKLKE